MQIFAVLPLVISYTGFKAPLKLFSVYFDTLKIVRNIYLEVGVHKVVWIKI